MKVIEYRLILPMTPEQYKRCQLYMVAKASLEDASKSTPETAANECMQILVNEEYEDVENDGAKGQYTHKRINIASKLPSWLVSWVDTRLTVFDEKSWNAFPHLKTIYECEIFSKAKVSMTSHHLLGVQTDDNALKLDASMLAQRKVMVIDIVNDYIPPKSYVASEDPGVFHSVKANIGPLKKDWMTNVPLVDVVEDDDADGEEEEDRQQNSSHLDSFPHSSSLDPTKATSSGRQTSSSSSSSAGDAVNGTETKEKRLPDGSLHKREREGSGGSAGEKETRNGESEGPRKKKVEGAVCSTNTANGLGRGGEKKIVKKPQYPLMTCYKLFIIDFPYFGFMAGKIENWIVGAMKDVLLGYHRKAVCWMDEWYDLTMADIRVMEDEVKEKIDALLGISKPPLSPSAAPTTPAVNGDSTESGKHVSPRIDPSKKAALPPSSSAATAGKEEEEDHQRRRKEPAAGVRGGGTPPRSTEKISGRENDEDGSSEDDEDEEEDRDRGETDKDESLLEIKAGGLPFSVNIDDLAPWSLDAPGVYTPGPTTAAAPHTTSPSGPHATSSSSGAVRAGGGEGGGDHPSGQTMEKYAGQLVAVRGGRGRGAGGRYFIRAGGREAFGRGRRLIYPHGMRIGSRYLKLSSPFSSHHPPRQEAPPPSALHSGFLFKLGDGIWNTTWNLRYIVLRGSFLQYFNDPRDVRPKHSVDIEGAKVSWCGGEVVRGRMHSFLVQPPGKRPMQFR
ncbi:phosphatidylinositol transfer protein [Cystoisospora suis]|uniref:Phosphatidylinositol transfer protein n=1 Tax=Cystoisospora suis TaxID=483139 RepID=A0A2C6KS78_9APIC|nr:phosphatidylinositol transfer protein [Cystoisospora suis]